MEEALHSLAARHQGVVQELLAKQEGLRQQVQHQEKEVAVCQRALEQHREPGTRGLGEGASMERALEHLKKLARQCLEEQVHPKPGLGISRACLPSSLANLPCLVDAMPHVNVVCHKNPMSMFQGGGQLEALQLAYRLTRVELSREKERTSSSVTPSIHDPGGWVCHEGGWLCPDVSGVAGNESAGQDRGPGGGDKQCRSTGEDIDGETCCC